MNQPSHEAVRFGPLLLLRLEGAAAFGGLLAAYGWNDRPGWLFAVLFFVPDVSMVAYLAGARLGAAVYNFCHSTIGPLLLGAVGILVGDAVLPWLSVIWAAHIGFDRMLGYGLKYTTGFKDTHLGAASAAEPASSFYSAS